MVCRFYGFGLEDVMNMTFRQFTIMATEMNVIMQMEFGGADLQPRSLTGERAHKMATKMFGKGRK